MIKKKILIFMFAICFSITFIGCKKNSPKMPKIEYTLEHYEYIHNGMPMTEINDILGPYGEEKTNVRVEDSTMTIKVWENKDGSNVVVNFENGKVTGKAQAGLKRSKNGFIRIGESVATKRQSAEFKKFPIENSINGVNIEITKVEQNKDALLVGLKYENNTDKPIILNYTDTRIIQNKIYQYYDIEFNILCRERKFKGVQSELPIELKPKEKAEIIIFYKPVNEKGKIDIHVTTLNKGINIHEFKNISIQK